MWNIFSPSLSYIKGEADVNHNYQLRASPTECLSELERGEGSNIK
jgi:hypothetical protein